jgi:hypothetical protein
MQPRLLPATARERLPLDSTRGVINRRYEFNGEEFYFSLHPELYPEGKSLDFTGRYLVVLLSIRGLETFYIVPGETEGYVMDDEDDEITPLTEIEIAALLEEVEGIHTTTEKSETTKNDIDLKNEDGGENEDRAIDWMEFDSEFLLLPLINQALKEHPGS